MQHSSEYIQSLTKAEHLLRVNSDAAAGYMKLLENANAQLKEVNATLERRLANSETLIKELRTQQGEDPSIALKDIHEYIQKVRDAHDRKKRRNNRTVSAASVEPASTSAGGAAE